MAFYSRQQLAVLFGLVAAAGAGLAIGQWRAAHPALAERLEQLDRTPATSRESDDGAATSAASASRPSEGAGTSSPSTNARSPSRRPAESTRGTSAAPGAGPRARKVHDPPSGEPPPGPVDLNQASLHDLTRLPGVGRVLAMRIVEERDRSGHFASIDDLRRVRGVGAAKLERLRAYVTVTE